MAQGSGIGEGRERERERARERAREASTNSVAVRGSSEGAVKTTNVSRSSRTMSISNEGISNKKHVVLLVLMRNDDVEMK